MLKYKTAYFCGYAKLPNSLPTIVSNGSLILGLEVDLESGKIVRASTTLVSPVGNGIVSEYFLNKHVENDYDQIVEEITLRHQGVAAKPLIKAYTDIHRNYIEYMKTNLPILTLKD